MRAQPRSCSPREPKDSVSPDAIRTLLPTLLQRRAPGFEVNEGTNAQALAQAHLLDNRVGTPTCSVDDVFPVCIDIQQQRCKENHEMRRVERWPRTPAHSPARA